LHTPGIVYWIDHYTIPTNDIRRAIAFHEQVLGATSLPDFGLPAWKGMFQQVSPLCQHALFFQREQLTPPEPLGAGLPRHAWFIDGRDIDAHLRRLDAAGALRSEPLRTAADGEDGTAIRWLDPDGNQLEFWAPRRLPPGAMEQPSAVRIGRISHGVYGSRDLERTIAFFARYCGLQPLPASAVAPDTAVFRLAAGGRLVFKLVREASQRISGRGWYYDLHTALTVREDDFWPSYERMWAELPEWEHDTAERFAGDGAALPARTLLHGNPFGRRLKAAIGRGDDWVDHDANLFHFVGGTPRDGEMTFYKRHFMQDYMDEYLAKAGG
jgi:predicted enzyme related to lactoylglutathione lyase